MIDMKQIKENVSSKMKGYHAQDEGSSPAREVSPPPKQASTGGMAIGASIKIKGDVTGDEDLVIQGQVEGTVNLKGQNVTISHSGKVRANINARQIIIEGELDGDMNAEEKVIVRATGNVHGNIISPRVMLEDGALFKGSIEMEPHQRNQQDTRPGINPVADKASELKTA